MITNKLILWAAWTADDECFPFWAPENFSMAMAMKEANTMYRQIAHDKRLVKCYPIPTAMEYEK